MTSGERKKGEEHLYREEKYATVYEINMLRCIFCGDCEEACPKEAIFLTDRIVESNYLRTPFVFGKDELVEPMEPREPDGHQGDPCFRTYRARAGAVRGGER